MSNHFATIKTKDGDILDLYAYEKRNKTYVNMTINHVSDSLPPLSGEDLTNYVRALSKVVDGTITPSNGEIYQLCPPK